MKRTIGSSLGFAVLLLPGLATAELSGEITEIQDGAGETVEVSEDLELGEVYTVQFEGSDIKDFHIKLRDPNAMVAYHAGVPCPPDKSSANVDVCLGSFTGGETSTSAGGNKYLSVYKSGGGISSGEIKIRFNSGTPGRTSHTYFTADGDADIGDGYHDGLSIRGPTLCSLSPGGSCPAEVPALSYGGAGSLSGLLGAAGVWLGRRGAAGRRKRGRRGR